MRRASRGRFVVPLSCSEVEGNDALIEAVVVPLSWVACCEFCVLGTVEDAVGGLGFGAPVAVAGGVDMPFCISAAAAGEAMLRGSRKRRECVVGMVFVVPE